MRVGIGYDIHRLAEDRKLVLGGVRIPYIKGLLGYSDGDVVMHAVSDAILGAIGEGDIGMHYPDTDPRYRDMDSADILRHAVSAAGKKNLAVNNMDIVIIAEEPRIGPFREGMVEALARAAGVEKERVNIKATTNEGVGSLGKGEAIAAYAVVSLINGA